MKFSYLPTNRENHFIVNAIEKDNGEVVYGGLFVTSAAGAKQLEAMIQTFLQDYPAGLDRNVAIENYMGVSEQVLLEKKNKL